MAKDQVTLEIVNENNKDANINLDFDVVERIFGKPPPVPDSTWSNGDLNNAGDKMKLLNGSTHSGDSDSGRTTQPLLETRLDKQQPPLAGPENDELDGDLPKDATPYPGIDDGLLEFSDKKPENPDHDDHGEHDTEHESGDEHNMFNNGGNGTDGKLAWEHDEPDYPYDTNGLDNRFGIDDRPTSPVPTAPDLNTYQQKKNLAQGMMDLALLSANANQLRYVLESSATHPYYYSSLTFISLSLIIQIIVGIGLIMNSQHDVNVPKALCKADKINNMTVIGIFLITIVNVFITSFSVATPTVGGVAVAPRSGLLLANGSSL